MQKKNQEKDPEILSFKHRPACFYCRLVLIFLLFFQTGFAQDPFAGIDAVLSQKKAALGNQAVVLVFKDGKTVCQKSVGDGFKPESAEPIGSASKWLTAALVMTFVDKKELSLDDPVAKYIPVFTSYSKGYITLRQCLSETTGIESDDRKLNKMVKKNKFENLEEEVNYFAAHKDIVANAGKEFFYGETGYTILGRVLEIVAKKKTFSKLMQERITRPLGMRRTNFANETGEGAENPASGAVSSAADYIKFLTMLLNGGEYMGKQILSKAAIAEMEKISAPSVPVKGTPKLTQGFHYGFGVWIDDNSPSKAPVICCPGTNGTWPLIDRCHGYAAIIFTPQQPAEPRQDAFLAIKQEIDNNMKGGCQ